MNLHDLIAGENITNGELEAKVSRLIGTALLCSMALNVVFFALECNRFEKKHVQ